MMFYQIFYDGVFKEWYHSIVYIKKELFDMTEEELRENQGRLSKELRITNQKQLELEKQKHGDAIYRMFKRMTGKDIMMTNPIKDIKTIIVEIDKIILDGVKIPHIFSNPVIRKEDGKWCIAFFVTFYKKSNLDNLTMSRPSYWALVDIETGELIKRYDCREKDFSSVNLNCLIDVEKDKQKHVSREDVDELFKRFDNLRKACILNNDNVDELNSLYLEKLLEITPTNYQRFYFELMQVKELEEEMGE